MNKRIFIATIIICNTIYSLSQAKNTKNNTEKTTQKTKVGLSAERLEGGKDENGIMYKKLEGNVMVKIEEVTIYADSAIYYDDTRNIIAEGNVRIVHDDGSVLTGDRIIYNDETKIAELEGNILMESEKATFTANYLSYNTKTQRGYFKYGGKLIEGDNIITSDSGYYDRKNKIAFLETNVTLANNDYSINTESLKYSEITKVAKFKGYTTITSTDGKKTFTTYNGGEYNTKKKFANFAQGGTIETDKFTIVADVITADQEDEIYRITGNVSITGKEEDIILTGEYGVYNKKEGKAEIFGNTLMSKQLDNESLYLCADKFLALEVKDEQNYNNEETKVEVHASGNVKMYKSDIQAKASSMVYKESESKIYVEGSPIFWNHQNQITADEACIILQDKKLHEIQMYPNSFFVFRDGIDNFNQVSGERISIHCTDNSITDMIISGNVEVVYYVIDKKTLKGLNVIKCGEISINLQDENINKINFPIKAQGKFYPPQLIKEEYKWLKNFTWREEERPTELDVKYSGFGVNSDFEEFKF